ncbi:SDR family NAD(P)-dependent oxidoreductase [Mucilaginibacter lacusdianchii]|uniref:SDR family NAD(P)-dependent oxidoreductase n=1 Tax=Mucilaginibacter lacusdianchii TaxID=2684211 RepID=UPI00131BA74C|nr:SDR family NAD(P)-dependent oxidoreductase [Mucilaginibacter sp. JXJ CY 39]
MANQNFQKNRIALITGATQGIGLQVAKELAANGYTVLLGSRNFAAGLVAAKNIGNNVIPIQIDVTDQTSIINAVEQIRKDLGRIDVLVNNAGISQAGKPDRTAEEVMNESRASIASLDEVKSIWKTNVFGVIAVTQAMLPLLKQSTAGRIVNVSSALGSLHINSDPDYPYRKIFGPGYAASKTALNAVTLSFAIDLEPLNIKVNLASPGFPSTALNNFQGTDTIEVASRNIVRAALDESEVTGTFTGSDGNVLPW